MQELFDEPVAGHTTMRVGGPAARLVVVETADELVDAVREVDDAEEPLLVLAGGSNLVVSDAGFDGTVVKVATSGVHVDSEDQVRRGERQRRGGGGLGRPRRPCGGTGVVGGGGAVRHPGVDRCDAGAERRCLRPGGRADHRTGAGLGPADQQVRTMTTLDCRFTYRHSLFKGANRYVVIDVMFQLAPDAVAAGALRRPRHPARGGGGGAGAARPSPRGGAGPAPTPGHGAGCRRPRHVELRVVLHQPRPPVDGFAALERRVADRLGADAPRHRTSPTPTAASRPARRG